VTEWRVYYSDDTTISSEDTTPAFIERRADVQVIVQREPEHNWVTRSGKDYYIWDKRGGQAKWFGVDIFGLHHYLLQPGHKCVLFGTEIDSDRFREIFNRARDEFGDKQSYSTRERNPRRLDT